MRLVDIVKIDNRFEKSVNLLLDLNNLQKIQYYIPTRSSINLLKSYLEEVLEFTGGRANILIGPYGKGKSHLLLVLMSILSDIEGKEMTGLFERISELDVEAIELIKKVHGKKHFLPVIVNTNSGNLGQAFVRSLSQALRRDGLDDVVPDNYFSEAVKMINQWNMVYPQTYEKLEKLVGGQKLDKFLQKLEQYDYQALEQFRTMYPVLTSGSEFNPIIDDEVLSVYQSVNRTLCEKHGYTGIYIIFDEFSKYVEGHWEEGFSTDMKVLQDICELCNSSKDEQLHLTCVAHKAVRSYGDALSKEVQNAFRGVEGRLKEIPFIVSSQNNYELIADAIRKKEKFAEWKVQNTEYQNLMEQSYQIPDFNALFERNDFDKIVGEGCYPLTPLAALLLLGLSEKIAQNERTIFTFLTGKDMYSLANFVLKCRQVIYIGAGLIYDYFTQLFEAEKASSIHNEWLKADYALSKTENENEKTIIKSLAVIHMLNRPDDVPANDLFLRLASGFSKNEYVKAVESLVRNGILKYKPGIAAYEFQNGVSVNIESEVADCAKKYFPKVGISEVLNDVFHQKYILPKKYNQDYFMTRYYGIEFIESLGFLSLASLSYVKDKNDPDGFLFVLCDGDIENEAAVRHLAEINDPGAILGIPHLQPNCRHIVQQLLAVRKLKNDREFTEKNEALVTELKNYEIELVDELNNQLLKMLNSIDCVYTFSGIYKVGSKGLNRTVSDICESTYYLTPKINNESINRHNISSQISKARNIILDDMLHTRLMNRYEKGTSAESTIYRAVMLHTTGDKALSNVRNEIVEFIHESKGKKVCFSRLINKLTKAPIGIRKGVLPIYITEQLMKLEDMPVIYNGRTEVSIDVQQLVNVVNSPNEYSLYVEIETGQKLEYIEGIEKLFADYGIYCRYIENKNRLAALTCMMQSWYRSLPQTSRTFMLEDFEGQSIGEIHAFRRLFAGTINPREVLFEQIPKIFREKDMVKTLKGVSETKEQIDGHIKIIKRNAEMVVRKELGLPEKDDFLLSMKTWYRELPDMAKNSVYSIDSQRLLNSIRELTITNVEEIIEVLSKEVTGFFVEDWSDTSLKEFSAGFTNLIEEIKGKTTSKDNKQSKKVSFVSENGIKDCFYNFDIEKMSTSAYFFQNALEDIVEEYGNSIENNEKIGILMSMVQKLMGMEEKKV